MKAPFRWARKVAERLGRGAPPPPSEPAPAPPVVAREPFVAAPPAAVVPPAVVAPEPAPVAPPPASGSIRVSGAVTPNPNAMKFTCSVRVVPKGSLSFHNAVVASAHPLGRALFTVEGVRSVFAVNDFVTVTKDDDASWQSVGPAVERTLARVLAEQAT